MVTANASSAPGNAPIAARRPVGIGGRRARDASVSARRGISTMFPPSAENALRQSRWKSARMMQERQSCFCDGVDAEGSSRGGAPLTFDPNFNITQLYVFDGET